MPIIKSAKKKLRQDKKRTQQNLLVKKFLKTALNAFKRKPTAGALAKVSSTLDIAAKKKIIHANKAARLKSRLSKLVGKKSQAAQKSKVDAKPKPPRKKKSSV